ncbi:hypothetical protein R3P38DRAFT_496601 [Favolaschia claudopus]|uniref:DUF6699 domain-containing protein n=1 Tax=Favolaschia claudopus TaxID=2862362 RepID=A0AAW0CMN5_9AGAR
MAAPFVYVPEPDPSAYAPAYAYPAAYPNPYFNSPLGATTPVLPPASLLPSPNAFNPNSVLWPEDVATQYESAYTQQWVPLAPRQRTTSWSAPAPKQTSPFLAPTVPAFLQAQPFKPGHKKANSWTTIPAWVNNVNISPYFPSTAPPASQLIHPFLNGDAPSPAFHFDLAPSAFVPMRLVSTHPPSGAPLSALELREGAFHPPLTALRIIHPRLPHWPIDLALPAGVPGPAPPISLAAVLVSIHRALHTRITGADWATLSPHDVARVTAAFSLRCRNEAMRNPVPGMSLGEREVQVRNQGVLRVDWLKGKTVFKGLVRHEGYVELLTA